MLSTQPFREILGDMAMCLGEGVDVFGGIELVNSDLVL